MVENITVIYDHNQREYRIIESPSLPTMYSCITYIKRQHHTPENLSMST